LSSLRYLVKAFTQYFSLSASDVFFPYDLIEKGGAFSIKDYAELESKIRFLLSDIYILKMASEISRNYVKYKRGATGKILDRVKEYV